MSVAFAELGLAVKRERREIHAAIDRVLDSGRYVGGEEVAAFEREWAKFSGAARCVACGSGTDAIKIALRALGRPGGRVLTVANSAPATVTAIVEAGMRPLFCDVVSDGQDQGLMDLDDAERVVRKYAPAVLMPVHLYGRMVDMVRAQEIGRIYGVAVVEDACQAHGSTDSHGTRPGERSAAACWSGYPTKNCGALGDAGWITVHGIGGHAGREAERRMRWLGNYGLKDRASGGWARTNEVLAECGWNSRMDPIQAAILRTRIPRIHEFNAHRAALANVYGSRLGGIVPVVYGGNYHIAAIRTKRREALVRHMDDRGIVTRIHYARPAHRQPPFERPNVSLPATEAWCREVLSLPLSNYTMMEQAREAADAVVDFYRRKGSE